MKKALDSVVSGGRRLDGDALYALAKAHEERYRQRQKRVTVASRKVRQYWVAALVPAAALAILFLAGLPGMRLQKTAREAAAITAEIIIPSSTQWIEEAFSGYSEASYVDDYIEDLWGSQNSEIFF